MKRKKSESTGTKRMQELGYKPLQLWLSPTMVKWLTIEAGNENMPKARLALQILQKELSTRHVQNSTSSS